MFVTRIKNLGEVKAKESYTVYFEYTEGMGTITRFTTPCDCTGAGNEPDNKRIVVTYRPNAVPPQLKAKGVNQYDSKKSIFVVYISLIGTEITEELFIVAKVKE